MAGESMCPKVARTTPTLRRTPAQGAETSIYLSSSPEVEGISSKYFMDCKMSSSSPSSYDSENAARFFDRSMELTGAPPLPSI